VLGAGERQSRLCGRTRRGELPDGLAELAARGPALTMRSTGRAASHRTSRQPLGDRIREARERSGVRLRALEQICRRLCLDLDELLAAAGRLDPETKRYLRRSPAAIRLLRKIARLRLGEAGLRALERRVEPPARRRGTRAP